MERNIIIENSKINKVENRFKLEKIITYSHIKCIEIGMETKTANEEVNHIQELPPPSLSLSHYKRENLKNLARLLRRDLRSSKLFLFLFDFNLQETNL